MTLVKGDPKAPFSIATTLRSGGGASLFSGLLHFTLDPYHIMQWIYINKTEKNGFFCFPCHINDNIYFKPKDTGQNLLGNARQKMQENIKQKMQENLDENARK